MGTSLKLGHMLFLNDSRILAGIGSSTSLSFNSIMLRREANFLGNVFKDFFSFSDNSVCGLHWVHFAAGNIPAMVLEPGPFIT